MPKQHEPLTRCACVVCEGQLGKLECIQCNEQHQDVVCWIVKPLIESL